MQLCAQRQFICFADCRRFYGIPLTELRDTNPTNLRRSVDCAV